MPSSQNIIIGPATILLNGTDIGYTKDGVTVSFPREYTDVMADQAGGIVKKARQSEKMTVSFSILEITLDLLRICWDQPTTNVSSGFYYLGSDNSCNINTHTLTLRGVQPGSCTLVREFHFYSVIQVSEAEYGMKRDEETALGVEFECLKSAANANRFGYVKDLT